MHMIGDWCGTTMVVGVQQPRGCLTVYGWEGVHQKVEVNTPKKCKNSLTAALTENNICPSTVQAQ